MHLHHDFEWKIFQFVILLCSNYLQNHVVIWHQRFLQNKNRYLRWLNWSDLNKRNSPLKGQNNLFFFFLGIRLTIQTHTVTKQPRQFSSDKVKDKTGDDGWQLVCLQINSAVTLSLCMRACVNWQSIGHYKHLDVLGDIKLTLSGSIPAMFWACAQKDKRGSPECISLSGQPSRVNCVSWCMFGSR